MQVLNCEIPKDAKKWPSSWLIGRWRLVALGSVCLLGKSMAASAMPQIVGELAYKLDPLPAAPQPQQTDSSAVVGLDKFSFPSEKMLRSEIRVTEIATYEKSVEILSAWVKGKLGNGPGSAKEKLIDIPCRQGLDPSDAFFPMSEWNLRCLPWWLDQRSFRKSIRDQADKLAQQKAQSEADAQQIAAGKLQTLEDWKSLKGISYRAFLRRFSPKTPAELFKHIDFAMNTAVTCDQSVALSGLVGRTEEFLPDLEVWSHLRKIYDKYRACQSKDESAESLHLRMGLTAIFFGEVDLAMRALTAALEAPQREERQRTLFWLGLLARTEANEKEVISNFQNKYWAELWQESPLSIHSVVASHVSGQDPYAGLVGDTYLPVRRRDSYQWSDYNLVALMAELFVAKEDALALRNWSLRIARDWKEEDNEKRLFLGILHNKAQNYLESIQLLATYVRAGEKRNYNAQFMKLLFPTPFAESILNSSEDLDPLLVYGLIRQESAFNPFARSLADARGLMQLLPSTANTLDRVSPSELYDPSQNVRLGTKYLRKLLSINDNHLERVLAAYNAGQKNLARWTKRFPGANDLLFADLIPFKETRSYVSLIQRNTYWYGRLWFDQVNTYGPELRERLANLTASNKARSRTVDSLLQISWSGNSSAIDPQMLLPQINDMRHFANQ